MNFNFKLISLLNKTLIYIQGMAFALLGLFLPLSIGWYNHNVNYLSSLNPSELQYLASSVNMSIEKFNYVYNNFTIAISAIFVILIWKLAVWLEGRNRDNLFSLMMFQLSACVTLFVFLERTIRYLFSYN